MVNSFLIPVLTYALGYMVMNSTLLRTKSLTFDFLRLTFAVGFAYGIIQIRVI